MCDACSISDPFELVARHDNAGLEAALALEPSRASARNSAGASLLAWAAYVGNRQAVAIIRPLLDRLDPHEAIIVGETDGLDAALAAGWNPQALSADGFPPLALAAFFANEAAFALLLPLTGDIDRRAENAQQVAAIHAAVARRNAAMLDRLLRAGADPNLTQSDGFTPLHAAAHNGDASSAGLLLLFGADRLARNGKGQDAADLADAAGHGWLAARLR